MRQSNATPPTSAEPTDRSGGLVAGVVKGMGRLVGGGLVLVAGAVSGVLRVVLGLAMTGGGRQDTWVGKLHFCFFIWREDS